MGMAVVNFLMHIHDVVTTKRSVFAEIFLCIFVLRISTRQATASSTCRQARQMCCS